MRFWAEWVCGYISLETDFGWLGRVEFGNGVKGFGVECGEGSGGEKEF